MKIEIAKISDVLEIRKLIIESAKEHKKVDFSDSGWEIFISANSENATRNRINDPRYFTLCCRVKNELVGVITIRDNEKIEQLFVKKENRGQGIARKLWNEVCNLTSVVGKEIWVRSSTMAVPVYESFGFRVNARGLVSNGIKYTHLVKKVIN